MKICAGVLPYGSALERILFSVGLDDRQEGCVERSERVKANEAISWSLERAKAKRTDSSTRFLSIVKL